MSDPNDLIRRVRKEYQLAGLDEGQAPAEPLTLFQEWFAAAVAAGLTEPNGMTLATVGPDGRPSARIVLMKDFDEHGVVFYTNYRSRKGIELARNPQAALLFWWVDLERQVRIEGPVSPVEPAAADAYFASRPRGSQLGAWASPQSAAVPDRESLAARLAAVEERFANEVEVPRPPHWGGYRLSPRWFEFWQGRPSRLHDRLSYELAPDGSWKRERLAP